MSTSKHPCITPVVFRDDGSLLIEDLQLTTPSSTPSSRHLEAHVLGPAVHAVGLVPAHPQLKAAAEAAPRRIARRCRQRRPRPTPLRGGDRHQ